jgi:YYY domain-containing protein
VVFVQRPTPTKASTPGLRDFHMTTEPTTVSPQPEPAVKKRWTWLPVVLLLLGILAFGAYFRLGGLNWSDGNALHPDENFLSQVTSAIQPPANVGEYFNSQTSSLNPYNKSFGLFVYGDLPIFITRYTADVLDGLCKAQEQLCLSKDGMTYPFASYQGVQLLGRGLSAIFDLFTLLFMFFIGKRLYGVKAGLLAAAFGAATVLQIQQSHFYTADIFATFFVVAAMFFIIRLGDTFSWLDTIAAGAASGLAVASRINVAPIVGILVVALFVPVFRQWRDPQRTATIEGAVARLVVSGIVALIAFRIFMPYAFDGLLRFDERWSSNMSYAQKLNSGEDPGGPPGVQWSDRTPLVFPWVNIVFWGMGVPLGLAAWIGWAWAAWQTFVSPYLRNRHGKISDWISGVAQSQSLLIWLWVTGYFVWMGSTFVKSVRYQLPIYPFLSILAAAGLVALLDRAARAHRKTLWRAVSIAVVVFVIVGAYGWAFAFTDIYRQTTTRVAASEWIYDNVPTAVTLRVDQNGAPRALQLPFANSVLLGVDNQPVAAFFKVEADSTLQSATVNRLIDLNGDPDPETLRLTIGSSADGGNPIASADLTANVEQAGARGGSFTFNFAPVMLPAGDYVASLTSVSGAPMQAESSTIAVESWDETVPVRVGDRDAYGIYHGVEVQRQWEDTPDKLNGLVDWLTQSDYVTLSSNRAYAPMSRQPRHFPMTTEYYRALFSGELGYKLAASIESYPTLGPFNFPDQETTQYMGLWPDPTRCPQAGVSSCRNLINVPLPPAEEAFSVYDHPRVLVFQKTPDFDPEKVRAVLSKVDLSNVLSDISPKDYSAAAGGLMLSDQTWQAQQETGTWSNLFDRNGLFNQAPLIGGLAWYLTIFLIGLFAFPIVFAAAPGLRDRGYGISRMAGLLVAVFVIWFLASYQIVPFTRATILLSVLALGLVGGIAAWRQRDQLRAFFKANRRTLLIEEALFGVAFLFFLFVRFGNPDLWHPVMGGEKPMDFAYLNAVIRSQSFPPYDPWFAGGQITYYYFGFVLIAALTKLLGIMPSIAYNFAIPTLFALTALGAFTVAFNLVQAFGRWVSDRSYWLKNPAVIGVIAAVFVVFMGNLGGVQVVQQQISKYGGETFQSTITPLKQVVDTVQGAAKMVTDKAALKDLMRPEWWYFTPTREIPAPTSEAGPISEFPYFTFLYADLHAHMIAMPITLLVLALAVSWLTRPPLGTWGGILSIGLGGLAAGALRPTNTWDWPTSLVIGTVALFMGTWANEPLDRISTWVRFILRTAGFVLIGFVAFMPFTRSYATAYSSIEEWKGSLTPWWAYLNIHLLFLFPIVTFIVWEIKRWGWRWWRALWSTLLKQWRWVAILIGLIIAALIFLVYHANRAIVNNDGLSMTQQRDVALIALPIMLACMMLALRPRLSVAQRFWYFVVFLAVALTLVVEIVVLKGDISRMNTTFKFYLQVWILLGISAAVALGWLADRLQRWHGWGAWLWKGFMGLLVAASFFYVLTATPNKMSDRWVANQASGLNGNDYMSVAEYGIPPYKLQWDYEAIKWLQDNVQGTPVVAEAASGLLNVPLYQWGSRISINTGLPTIIGWDWHQRQQRSIMPGWVIDRRLQDVSTLYRTLDTNAAQDVLNRYNVKYIVVGPLERVTYVPDGADPSLTQDPAYISPSLTKFDQMAADGSLKVVFQNEGTKIYEVVR